MGLNRTPFQGVWNIVRFNYHFYLYVLLFLALTTLATIWLQPAFSVYLWVLQGLVLLTTLTSLVASWYIYDFSDLYEFKPLQECISDVPKRWIHIHAGFDETSPILATIYPQTTLQHYDFYNPELHTEVSIKRARKAYPPHPETERITTSALPFEPQSISVATVLFSAHEIRNPKERIEFFMQLKQALNAHGQIIVMEHLRDIPNALVFNIGCLHFYSHLQWMDTFKKSGLHVKSIVSCTPFVKLYQLTL